MKTKTILLTLCALVATLGTATAQETIALPQPQKTLQVTLMQALTDRKSLRDYSTREIPMQELSNLLWAANGVNREDGRRTAPSAINAQDIDVYVVNSQGAYLYNAPKNQLEQVYKGDLRKEVAGRQEFAATAPISLVLVCDGSRYSFPDGGQKFGGMDAGYVSQNIYLYCAAAGLATVARASMDAEALKKALNLKESQILELNHPVGYPEGEKQ